MTRSVFPVLFAVLLVFCSVSYSQTDSTFKPSGKIVAQFFMDYFYKVHQGENSYGTAQYTGVKKNFANFDVRRVFLGYNYDFSPSFTGEILLSYEGNLDGSGNRGFLLKVADIKWKNIYPNADLVVGLQFTPTFVPLTEKIWGYRSIEKSLSDKNRISPPTDVGIGIQASFDDEKNYGYNLLYANGAGTKPETDKYKKIYGDLWGKFLDKKIIIDIYGDLNQLREIPQIVYTTVKFFAAYQTPALTLGVEAFTQFQTNSVDVSTSSLIEYFDDAKLFGISAFIRGEIIENCLNFFARYDGFDPNQNFDPNLFYYTAGYYPAKEHFVTAGLDYTPHPSVHIMPNIWYNRYTNKLPKLTGTLHSDYDLVPRVTFSFRY